MGCRATVSSRLPPRSRWARAAQPRSGEHRAHGTLATWQDRAPPQTLPVPPTSKGCGNRRLPHPKRRRFQSQHPRGDTGTLCAPLPQLPHCRTRGCKRAPSSVGLRNLFGWRWRLPAAFPKPPRCPGGRAGCQPQRRNSEPRPRRQKEPETPVYCRGGSGEIPTAVRGGHPGRTPTQHHSRPLGPKHPPAQRFASFALLKMKCEFAEGSIAVQLPAAPPPATAPAEGWPPLQDKRLCAQSLCRGQDEASRGHTGAHGGTRGTHGGTRPCQLLQHPHTIGLGDGRRRRCAPAPSAQPRGPLLLSLATREGGGEGAKPRPKSLKSRIRCQLK